jgi:hypothetical protein
MALNFPASPTDGQQVTSAGLTYTWTTATGAWVLTGTGGSVGPMGPPGATGPAGPPGPSVLGVSDTAPGSPVNGQLWWNSVNGNLYIWYVDADSSQWVQINTVGT